MTVDIEKLEALAKAAIEQEKRWKDAGEPWPIWNKCLLEMQASANPAAVLELTKDLKRNQRMLLAAVCQLGEINTALGADMDSDCDELIGMIADLKSEISGLKTGYEAYERVNAELRAECEAMRSKFENPDPILIQCMDSAIAEQEQLENDAKRYRWLRDGAGYCDTRDIPGMAPARMDAFIDAAMSKEQSHD